MKKLFRIFVAISVVFFCCYLVVFFTYMGINNDNLTSHSKTPDWLSYPLFGFVFAWMIIGVIAAIVNIKSLSKLLTDFINDKN